MTRWRLPKQRSLGPNFTIKIEEGSLTDTNGEWLAGYNGGIIRLKKGLTKAQQRYYYTHELVHAALDYCHQESIRGAVS